LTDQSTDTSGPDSSTDNSTDDMTIPLYNTAYNSALQFWLTKTGETIRASEQRDLPWSKSGCLVADVSRIGRSNGKGNPWQGQFLVALFGR